MDSGGDATVFWWRKNGFDAVQRRSSGAFDAPVHVSAIGVGTHQVLMDSSGKTTFLYKPGTLSHPSDAYLLVRRLSQAGDLGPPMRVGKVGRGGGEFALDGSGNALIVWAPSTDRRRAVRDRVLSENGVLGPTQAISTAPAYGADVAVNAAGDAVIGWLQPEASGRNSMHVVDRAADGTLGPQHEFAAAGLYNWAPFLGLDDSGRAVAAWTRRTDADQVLLSVDP
jgi:hypothetical protein